MNSKKRLLLTLVLVSVLAISMMACSTPAPSAKPAPAPATSAPAPAPATTTTAAPASPKPATTTSAPATTTAAPPASPKATVSPMADFYGKNVLTIHTSSAGGSNDFLARLIATYWSQKVEGGLARVINNQGGNKLTAATYLQKESKPDGLSIGILTELEASVLLGDPAAKYDPTAFIYIGNVGKTPPALYLSPKKTLKTVADLKGASGFIFGNVGLVTSDAISAAFLSSALEMKSARLVTDYTGTAELGLALGRGEVNGATMGAATGREHVANGLALPAVILLDYVKSAWFPDTITLASQLAKLTPEQTGMLDFIVAMQSSCRIMTTPGVTQDKVDFLSDIIMSKIMNDKNFLAQVKLRWPVWDKPMSGPEYAAKTKKDMSVSKETVEAAKAMVKKMAGL